MTPEASFFIQLVGHHRELSVVARGAPRGSVGARLWKAYTGDPWTQDIGDLEFMLDKFEAAGHPDAPAMRRAWEFCWLRADAHPRPDFDWQALVGD